MTLDNNPMDDHWNRLAQELGLEIEPPERTSPAVSEQIPTPVAPPPAAPDLLDDEPPPSRGRRRRRDPEPHQVGPPAEAPDAEPTLPISDRDSFPNEIPSADRELELEPRLDSVVTGEPVSDTKEESGPPRRRRGRSRRRKGEEGRDVGAAGQGSDAGDEPIEPMPTSLSSWNIPTWYELIASLHRPDR